MPGKMIYYQQLAEAVTRQIAGDPQEWARFLTTAARLYLHKSNAANRRMAD